jgi:hypothetical protein
MRQSPVCKQVGSFLVFGLKISNRFLLAIVHFPPDPFNQSCVQVVSYEPHVTPPKFVVVIDNNAFPKRRHSSLHVSRHAITSFLLLVFICKIVYH